MVGADLLLPGHDRRGAGVALDGRMGAQDRLELHAPGHREHGRGEQRDQRAGERAEAAASAENGETQHRSAPQMREVLGDFVGAGRVERPGHPPVGEQHDPVGVCRRHGVVGDHHHRVPVLVDELAQQREHLASGVGVQRSGRLVGEHDLGPGDERPGDRDPLLLAAGQLRGAVAQALVQPDPGGDLTHRRAPRPTTVQAQRQGDVLRDGERWQQVEGLEDEADPLTPQDASAAAR